MAKHPTLYILLENDEYPITPPAALFMQYLTKNAFVLHQLDDIRGMKAQIQENPGGLNLKRINIYIVIAAHGPSFDEVASAGAYLQAVFAEDFAIVSLTLAVLLHESNAGDDYEVRSARSFELLSSIESQHSFDRVLLLSDRNELDVVNTVNMENNWRILGFLPALTNYEQQSLTSAGMATLTIPQKEIEQAVQLATQRELIAIVEQTLHDEDHYKIVEPPITCAAQIVQDIMALPTCPVNARDVRNCSLREGEAMIYGETAARFFTSRYTKALPSDMKINDPTIEEYAKALSEKYKTLCKPGLLSGIESIKRQIGEAYVTRYRLFNLHYAHAQAKQRLENTQQALNALKKLRIASPNPQMTYYTQAVTRIFHDLKENHGTKILYEFFNDATNIQDAITAFINQYILPHPTIKLSFEEDLHHRATTQPATYNTEHLPTEAFYYQTLTQAEAKAAIAISLKRYDGLHHEKYYCCDQSSELATYAKNIATPTHFIHTTEGLTIIRLISGFNIKDLSRYEAMQVNHPIHKTL